MLNLSIREKIIGEMFGYCEFSQYLCKVIINTINKMEKQKLEEMIKELNEVIRDLNNSKHNYSYQLEKYEEIFSTN